MIPINIQPIEKRREFDDGSSLDVHSVFYTIQGEGPFSGQPCVFVRLAGCNLQCPSCDTEYTSTRLKVDIAGIVRAIQNMLPAKIDHKLVVITGGEPFRQNISELARLLVHDNFHVQVETNGTLAPSPMFPEQGTTIVCSPKAGRVNALLWPLIDAYKYVLNYDSMDLDGLPIRALNHTAAPRVARPHVGFNGPIYLQPCDSKDPEENAVNLRAVKRSCMQHGYLLQLQIHKIIDVP